MRIIAGTLKGRRLTPPGWDGLRPTSDRLRETLFNILGPMDGLRVLDLCAGTGALGLEALSRGAVHVTFVESDRRACGLIAANAAHCGVTDRCAIIRAVAPDLSGLATGVSFDVALLDPPYDAPHPDQLVAGAAARIAGTGPIVLEHAWRRAVRRVEGIECMRTVRAGDSALSFFRIASSDSSLGAAERRP